MIDQSPVNQQGIQVSICEERLEFSTPVATSGETILAPVREDDLHVHLKEERLVHEVINGYPQFWTKTLRNINQLLWAQRCSYF